MSHPVQVVIDVPKELDGLRLPAAVDGRLQELLDKQDRGEALTRAEREEAQGLVDLSELLSLLRMRAERAAERR